MTPGLERARTVTSRVLSEVGLDLPALGPGVDGDPGLFGPGSIVWTVGRERVLVAAGPAALLMQLAHPLVAAAVAEHSGFRRDPFARLRATLGATLAITFGDHRQAGAAAEGVRRVHRRVRGELGARAGRYAAGTPYDATDPELALWVHATLVVAALDAYATLVRPLAREERARYVDEVRPFGALFGVTDDVMPPDLEAFDTYMDRMSNGLTVGSDARTLSRDVLDPPIRSTLAPAKALMEVLTPGFLPEPIRAQYGLGFGPARRAAFRAATATVRATLPMLPTRVRWWPHARTAVCRTSSDAAA